MHWLYNQLITCDQQNTCMFNISSLEVESSINCFLKVKLCSSINLTKIEQIFRLIHTLTRILSTVMPYLSCFVLKKLDENGSGVSIKHGLKKIDEIPILIKNLNESNVGYINYELKIGG